MKHTIKVETIPFDYWQSSTLYNVGDWIQFVTLKMRKGFPYKIEARHKIKDNTYIYKLG